MPQILSIDPLDPEVYLRDLCSGIGRTYTGVDFQNDHCVVLTTGPDGHQAAHTFPELYKLVDQHRIQEVPA